MTSTTQALDLDARVAKLRERAEREFPAAWVPEEPGDFIAGRLDRYEKGTTSYGEQIIAILELPDQTERAVWLLHAVLRGEFAKQRPKPGELILVHYGGKKTAAGGGAPYAAYRLEVEREDTPFDWDAVAPGGVGSTQTAPPAPPPAGGAWPDDDIPF